MIGTHDRPRPPAVRAFCAKAPDNIYVKPGKLYYLRFYQNRYMVYASPTTRLCLCTVYKDTQNDRVNYMFYEADERRRLFELL